MPWTGGEEEQPRYTGEQKMGCDEGQRYPCTWVVRSIESRSIRADAACLCGRFVVDTCCSHHSIIGSVGTCHLKSCWRGMYSHIQTQTSVFDFKPISKNENHLDKSSHSCAGPSDTQECRDCGCFARKKGGRHRPPDDVSSGRRPSQFRC